MHYLVVTYHNTGNVNSEVTISFQKIGNGESEEYKCKQKNGIKGLIINIKLIQHEDGKFAEKVSGSCTYYELDNERTEDTSNTHSTGLYELYQHDGKHVSHRVITTTFKLQHGAKIVFQIHFLRT